MTVVFTDRPSEITGTPQDATGRPATDYFIVVFSTNRAYWTPLSRRVLQTRPGTDGTYLLRNLPAGEYLLAALTDLAPGDTSDPAFLGELAAAAVKVSVTDGTTTVQAFRIRGQDPRPLLSFTGGSAIFRPKNARLVIFTATMRDDNEICRRKSLTPHASRKCDHACGVGLQGLQRGLARE